MKHIVVVCGLLVVGVVIIMLYFWFDPATSPWAPKCLFKFITGWDCPACGGQRALHNLLQGNLQKAVMLNPFLLISLPYLGAVAYTSFVKKESAKRWARIVQNYWVVNCYIVLFLVWWIVRNTTWWKNLVV